MTRFILALLLSTSAATAQVARITTGEHDGFTRLVIESPQLGAWTLGRTPDGYLFDSGAKDIRYDVSDTFRLITKNRIATVWVDPGTNLLALGVVCQCHAVPFEYRNGVVVIDIKDGVPPSESPFELSRSGQKLAPLISDSNVRPRPRPASGASGYDWLSARADGSDDILETPFALPVTVAALNPLRQALIEEIGAGLSEGVLQRAEKLPQAERAGAAPSGSPWAQIVLGDLPGFESRSVMDVQHVSASAKCPDPDAVSIHNWLPAEDPVSALSASRHALVSEFDRPNPANIRSAAKTLIAFGFGAEAGQLLEQLDQESSDNDDQLLLHSIARLVDGRLHPNGPFVPLADCPSPAALWAFLSTNEASPPSPTQRDNILAAFSALPVHLRTALAQDLVDRFIAVNDADAAASLHQYLVRGSDSKSPSSQWLEAEIDLKNGSPDRAEATAEAIVAEDGQMADEKTILLIRSKLAQKKPIDADEVSALAALLPQYEGNDRQSELANLLTLATLASGQALAAHDLLRDTPAIESEFWSLLANVTPDDAFLELSILPDGAPIPQTTPEAAFKIAQRLYRAGFIEPAVHWASQVTGSSAERARILLAQAQLKREDPAGAISMIGGLQTRESQFILAQAHEAAQNWPAAETYWSNLGDNVAVNRVDFLSGNWLDVSRSTSSDWSSIASRLNRRHVQAGDEGALAQSQALVAESEADRAVLSDLIKAGSPTDSP